MSGYRLKRIPADETLAADGVWMPIGNGLAEARVRPATNPDFIAYVQKRIKPYRRQMDAGTLAAEVQLEIQADAVARTVLVDWRGIYLDDDDEEAEFSIDLAKRVLIEFPELLVDVMDAARDQTAFQRSEDQEAAEALGKD